MKFLYGQVIVKTLEIEVTDDPEGSVQDTLDKATAIANEKFQNPSGDKKMNAYILPWAEGGVMDSRKERDKVLAGFLELMTKKIPLTPYEEPKIILPFQN